MSPAGMVPAVMVSVLGVLGALTAGCSHPSTSATTFTTAQAQQPQRVEFGVVQAVRPVTIQPDQTGVGTVAGGALGGIAAGTNIGGGTGAVAAGLGGAVLGGLAGNAVESRATRRAGQEITVQLDSGSMVAIVQDADQNIGVGERVRVLSGGGVTRVTR